MNYKLDTKKPHIICLFLLISFPSVACVSISPALPAIANFFCISGGKAQQLITVFIVGYALGQLMYSPFANRFGRKSAIYLGSVFYFSSCLLCLLGIHIECMETLLFGRLFMGLGSAVGMVASYTIINDFYYPNQGRKIISFTLLAYSCMPSLAIVLAGFLTTYISWVSCFYFLLFYTITILFVAARLPETLAKKNPFALKIKSLLNNYQVAFKSKRLLLFSSIFGITTAFSYIILASAPFVGIEIINLKPSTYSLILLIPYAGQCLGSLFSGHMSHRISVYAFTKIAFSFLLLGTLFIFFSFLFKCINSVTLFLPLLIIMAALPIVYSNTSTMALLELEDKAIASAAMSFIVMTYSLVFSFILNLLPAANPLMMPALFILAWIASFMILLYCMRKFKNHT